MAAPVLSGPMPRRSLGFVEPYNPYAAPADQGPGPGGQGPATFRIVGKKVAFPRNTRFPSICIKCGTRDPNPLVRRMKNYTFVPWHGRLFGVIGAALTQRKATVDLPLCGRCDGRERSGTRALWIAVAIPFVGTASIVGGAFGDVGILLFLGVLMFVGGLLGALIVFLAVSLPRRLPLAVMIDDAEVTLAGIHPHAIEYFRTWSGPAA
jgi:hypothetical protein